MVKITDKEKYEEACQKLKYFEIGGKPCRGVPYDPNFLGSNRQAYNKTHTAFVAYNNKNLQAYSKDLEEFFSQYGEVKTAKAAINADYKLLGYGFVTFKEAESVDRAVEGSKDKDLIALHYNPKDKREAKAKLTNNIYVKNFPEAWTEKELKDVFGKHGNIKSLFVKTMKIPG